MPESFLCLGAGSQDKRAGLRAEFDKAYEARAKAKALNAPDYAMHKDCFRQAARRLAEHYAGVPQGVSFSLPDEPERYFHTEGAQMVPLSKIRPTEKFGGIDIAESLMRLSYEGIVAKRKPIALEQIGDDTYRIVDGNATFAVAQKHGWTYIPAEVI